MEGKSKGHNEENRVLFLIQATLGHFFFHVISFFQPNFLFSVNQVIVHWGWGGKELGKTLVDIYIPVGRGFLWSGRPCKLLQ